MLTEDVEREGAVLLYDGDCRLCQGTVRFVRERLKAQEEKRPLLRFVPAQSKEGQALLEKVGRAEETFHSVLLIEAEETSERSTAVLRTTHWMRFPWRALATLRVVPRPVRDAVYSFIARNRYRWFGNAEDRTCACATDQRRDPRS
ncbi:MAG: DUF393 domain-containing protein [Euryarchaeota archaeon]|nr:DUF393 domain-containing protein [Euryarchaeota archaeon]